MLAAAGSLYSCGVNHNLVSEMAGVYQHSLRGMGTRVFHHSLDGDAPASSSIEPFRQICIIEARSGKARGFLFVYLLWSKQSLQITTTAIWSRRSLRAACQNCAQCQR